MSPLARHVSSFWRSCSLGRQCVSITAAPPLLRVLLPYRDDLQDGFQGGCPRRRQWASTVQKDMAIMIEDEKVLRETVRKLVRFLKLPSECHWGSLSTVSHTQDRSDGFVVIASPSFNLRLSSCRWCRRCVTLTSLCVCPSVQCLLALSCCAFYRLLVETLRFILTS